jgi:hypothetical protein
VSGDVIGSEWTWTVFPENSEDPTIAEGVADDPQQAQTDVEKVLQETGHSAWGLLVGPDGTVDICRPRHGGVHWAPLYPTMPNLAIVRTEFPDAEVMRGTGGGYIARWKDHVHTGQSPEGLLSKLRTARAAKSPKAPRDETGTPS